MAGKEPDIGPTARAVADNITRLREAQRMNYTQLSERLQAVAGWSINAVGIRRIESGQRRVSPDDLVSLAAALDVSPMALLTTPHNTDDETVKVTGVKEEVTVRRLRLWLTGKYPLIGDTPEAVFGFIRRSTPEALDAGEVDLIESGLPPNRNYRVRWAEQVFELEKVSDGDD